VRERVAADVEEDDQVAAHRRARRLEPVRDRTRAERHVDEDRLHAQHRGNAGLGERDPALADDGLAAGREDARRDLEGVLDLVARPRPGLGVHH
jgi:hypothetical protein